MICYLYFKYFTLHISNTNKTQILSKYDRKKDGILHDLTLIKIKKKTQIFYKFIRRQSPASNRSCTLQFISSFTPNYNQYQTEYLGYLNTIQWSNCRFSKLYCRLFACETTDPTSCRICIKKKKKSNLWVYE